jgi:hypothetical protein
MDGYMLGVGICTGGDTPWTGICHERYAGKYFRGSCYDLFQGWPTAELLQLQN